MKLCKDCKHFGRPNGMLDCAKPFTDPVSGNEAGSMRQPRV